MADPVYYLGVLSGTSLDAINCGLFNFQNKNQSIFITGYSTPYPPELKKKLNQLLISPHFSCSEFGQLDTELGVVFAQAIQNFYNQIIFPNYQISKKQIRAIGSHGQNIWHEPTGQLPCTLQLGNPHIIFAQTGIPVISDFRRHDLACGGQGAPLAPLFHQAVFSDPDKNKNKIRMICNIGGISNLSVLSSFLFKKNLGFDTGPGNTLIDHWMQTHFNLDYDQDGQLARTGVVIPELLDLFLSDAYFSRAAPKSTGLEYFNLKWVESYGSKMSSCLNLSFDQNQKINILRTLLELTAKTITDQIKLLNPSSSNLIPEIYLCGGGAHNGLLVERIKKLLRSDQTDQTDSNSVYLTDKLGIPVDWVESGLFAWLAYQRMSRKKLDLKTITGNRFKKIQVGVRFD